MVIEYVLFFYILGIGLMVYLFMHWKRDIRKCNKDRPIHMYKLAVFGALIHLFFRRILIGTIQNS